MSNHYKLHEFPSIDDQSTIRYFYLLQELIIPINELYKKILNSPKTSKTTIGLVMPITFRIVECAQSAIILLSKKRIRDAGILFLNIYELRLDLMYISLNSLREEEWIESNTKHKKPWKVARQQTEVFTNSDELAAERKIYRDLSMIKHGNNAGSYTSFPISAKGNAFVLDSRDVDQITPQIFVLGGLLHGATKAALLILNKHENVFREIEEAVEKAYATLRDITLDKVEEMIYELALQRHPELKDIPDIKAKLRIDLSNTENEEEITMKVTLINK